MIPTGNYGQVGASDRYGPSLGLPRAYSGQNAYAEWGPPCGGPRHPFAAWADAWQQAGGQQLAASAHRHETLW